MRRPPILQRDLLSILDGLAPLLPLLQHRQLLITGGSGFFGTSLLEGLLHLDREAQLGLKVTVLTRDPERLRLRSPHIAAQPSVHLLRGDIRSFVCLPGPFSYVIHAAGESVRSADATDDDERSTIVDGTARVLALARERAVERLLYVSSGAVYGPQPPSITHLTEESPWFPTPSVYAAGKRAAEQMCVNETAVHCVQARAFAFHGPHLPLDAHFAAGNFLGDALRGTPITIGGDGTALRSYLYSADLVVWLVTLLLRGERGRAYNVGAEGAVSIRELAERTAAVVSPGLAVRVLGAPPEPGVPPPRYVPSTERARTELGLRARIGLDEAIARTAEWWRSQA